MSHAPRTTLLLAILLLAAPLPFAGMALAAGDAQVLLDNYEFATGETAVIVVTVMDAFGGAVTTADVSLLCLDEGCDTESALQPSPLMISGNGQPGRGAWGVYQFTIEPTQQATFQVSATFGDESDPSWGFAYFWTVDSEIVIEGVQAQPEATLGEYVPVSTWVRNTGPFEREGIARLLVDGVERDAGWLWVGPYEFYDISLGFLADEVGEHTVSVSIDGRAGGQEVAVLVIPPATLVSPDVSASPLFSTVAPLTLQDARDMTRATVRVTYDPALVQVNSVTPGGLPGVGTVVQHDAENGTITIRLAAAEPLTGNLTLASIEYGAVELHNTDSTLALDVLGYERASGVALARSTAAHFHGSILGATGDDVLREL
jgi:hypothetical protein